MIFGGFRVRNILLAAAITVAGLLLAASIFHITLLEGSLQKAVLSLPGVVSMTATPQGPQTVVAVSLGRVTDLRDTYTRLMDTVRNTLGDRPFSLVVRDNPDEALQEAYYEAHYAVEEAAVRGDFVSMREQVDEIMLHKPGITYRIYVEQDVILVQMTDAQHYLYRVVPRQRPAAGVNAGGQ